MITLLDAEFRKYVACSVLYAEKIVFIHFLLRLAFLQIQVLTLHGWEIVSFFFNSCDCYLSFFFTLFFWRSILTVPKYPRAWWFCLEKWTYKSDEKNCCWRFDCTFVYIFEFLNWLIHLFYSDLFFLVALLESGRSVVLIALTTGHLPLLLNWLVMKIYYYYYYYYCYCLFLILLLFLIYIIGCARLNFRKFHDHRCWFA